LAPCAMPATVDRHPRGGRPPTARRRLLCAIATGGSLLRWAAESREGPTPTAT
jgi:hypothetical protein